MPIDSALAFVLGAPAGLAGLRLVPELQTPAAVLLSSAFLLGAAYPDHAWRRGAMIGLSVPLAQLVAAVTGTVLPYHAPSIAWAFAALVPAFVGTAAGVTLRRVLGPGAPGATSSR